MGIDTSLGSGGVSIPSSTLSAPSFSWPLCHLAWLSFPAGVHGVPAGQWSTSRLLGRSFVSAQPALSLGTQHQDWISRCCNSQQEAKGNLWVTLSPPLTIRAHLPRCAVHTLEKRNGWKKPQQLLSMNTVYILIKIIILPKVTMDGDPEKPKCRSLSCTCACWVLGICEVISPQQSSLLPWKHAY